MGENKPQRWEGQVFAKLQPAVKPDQAWALLGDFCSLHKFLPSVATCRWAGGPDSGEPGCIRYCAAAPDEAGAVYWAKERLVAADAVKRSYSYVITESNMGFGSYQATLRVAEAEDGGAGVEWAFEAEPVAGWTRSGFVEYLQGGVKEMAKKIEDALCVVADVNGDGVN